MSQNLALPGFEPTEFGGSDDFWPTPRYAVDAIRPHLPLHRHAWNLIEPAAGRGALLTWLLPHMGELASVTAVELHAGRAKECHLAHPGVTLCQGDFLECDVAYWRRLRNGPVLFAMNPPYSEPRENIGLEFVQRALEIAQPDGVVAALLPLDFATGVERCAAIHDRYPGSLYPLRRRPHFGGPHSSGQRPFAWFVWDLEEPDQEWRVIG